MTMTADQAKQKLIAGGRILDAEGQADLTGKDEIEDGRGGTPGTQQARHHPAALIGT